MVGTTTILTNHRLLESIHVGIRPTSQLYSDALVRDLFRIFPQSEIYGIYVFFALQGVGRYCPEINVWIPDRRDKERMTVFQEEMAENLISLKMRSLVETEEAFFLLVGNTDIPEIQVILSFGEPISRVHWTISCLSINPQGKLNLFYEVSGQRGRFLNLIYQDLQNKHLRWIGDFRLHNTQFEVRICYLKLIRDLIYVLERFQNWTLKSPLQLRMYQHDISTETVCGICHERAEERYSLQIKCNHVFHLDCVSENMMELSPSADSCPVCRADILSYDYNQNTFQTFLPP